MSNSSPLTQATRRPWGSAGTALACISLVALATAAPAAAASKPAPSPSRLVQAVAIAAESRSQVVTLHDLAVSLGKANAVPAAVVHSSAQRLERTFAGEGKAAAALGQPASSPTSALAATLVSYGDFAAQVFAASAKKVPSLGTGFTKSIKANDKRWEAALSALGKADDVNLLKEVPPLLYPIPGP